MSVRSNSYTNSWSNKETKSFELDEVMDVADRVIVMFEGEIMGNLDPKKVSVEEMGLYMAGVKREEKNA